MAVLAPNSHIELKIAGMAEGQRIDTSVYYWNPTADGIATLQTFVEAFRTEYRASFLPLLHLSYSVIAYNARTIARLINLETSPGAPPRPVFRYSDQHLLLGDAVDDKGLKPDPMAPTFTAIGTAKVCGLTRTIRNTAVTGGGKQIRGSTRLGPIDNASMIAFSGNSLDDAVVIAADAAYAARKVINAGGTQCHEIVVSKMQDGQLWTFGGLPEFVFAEVTSYKTNVFATSQVSRKQTLNNLG